MTKILLTDYENFDISYRYKIPTKKFFSVLREIAALSGDINLYNGCKQALIIAQDIPKRNRIIETLDGLVDGYE